MTLDKPRYAFVCPDYSTITAPIIRAPNIAPAILRLSSAKVVAPAVTTAVNGPVDDEGTTMVMFVPLLLGDAMGVAIGVAMGASVMMAGASVTDRTCVTGISTVRVVVPSVMTVVVLSAGLYGNTVTVSMVCVSSHPPLQGTSVTIAICEVKSSPG